MIVIEPLSDHPSFVETALRWIHNEWPDSAPEEETLAMLNGVGGIPQALVAISAGSPIGVLGFKRHEIESEIQLWINAVYVIPKFRRAGVGTSLVTGAVESSRAFGVEQLYVYTDVAHFYREQGWNIQSFREGTGMTVLKLDVTAPTPRS